MIVLDCNYSTNQRVFHFLNEEDIKEVLLDYEEGYLAPYSIKFKNGHHLFFEKESDRNTAFFLIKMRIIENNSKLLTISSHDNKFIEMVSGETQVHDGF